MIVKWWWRLRSDKDALWCRVIRGLHKLDYKPSHTLSLKSITGVWNNIAGVKKDLQRAGIDIEDIIAWKMNSGNDTLFWLDRWCGGNTLKEEFPELYRLEENKRCKVKDRIGIGGADWRWRSSPTSDSQLRELSDLITRTGTFHPAAGEDKWSCEISDDGIYYVNKLRKLIDEPQQVTPLRQVIAWTHDVPIKVLCFIWRANLERIPTATELIKRGVPGVSEICGYCEDGVEDVRHVLWSCTFAKNVWKWVFHWCNIEVPTVEKIEDIIKFTSECGNCVTPPNQDLGGNVWGLGDVIQVSQHITV